MTGDRSTFVYRNEVYLREAFWRGLAGLQVHAEPSGFGYHPAMPQDPVRKAVLARRRTLIAVVALAAAAIGAILLLVSHRGSAIFGTGSALVGVGAGLLVVIAFIAGLAQLKGREHQRDR